MSQITEIPDVVSFDLYDTVIMRKSLTTTSLYGAVWVALSDSGNSLPLPDREIFIEARKRADKASKYIDAPSLTQILEHLDDDLRGLAKEIESAEIELELEQLRTIPGGAERVKQAREAGCRIAFISDMHIGAEHLGPKLGELGLMLDGDLLLVSSDCSLSKSRKGRLFKHFLKINDLSPKSLTHIGNDQWSDGTMATKHGISTCPYLAGNLNRFETLVLGRAVENCNLEKIASVARDVRLQSLQSNSSAVTKVSMDEEALVNVASSVVAPVMLAFVLWAIERCKQEGISTLRFLTRDGELPYLIAKQLPESIIDGLDLDMLEVSRRSILLPAASVIPLDRWLEVGLEPGAFLAQHFDRLPARQLIARVGMSFDKHADLLKQFDIVDWDEPLGKVGLDCWKRALLSVAVKQEIEAESHRRLEDVQSYLRQNLFDMSNRRSALIDIGWTGQQAAMLSALIQQSGGQDPLHLHVGRLRDRPLIAPADVEGWLFDERVKRSPVENPVALFESFCVTLEGGIDGYQSDDSGNVKVVKRSQPHKANIVSWGQPVLRKCVLNFAAQAGIFMNEIDPELLRVASEELLCEFWDNPTWQEANKWGAFPYEQDQTGQTIRKLANPYNLAQLRTRLSGTYSGIDWKAGSIELSPVPMRQLLKLREKFRK